MRFLIEHRGHYSLFHLRPRYTLHLAVEFSDEERAIIRTRALQNTIFDLSPGMLGSKRTIHSPNALAVFDLLSIKLFTVGFGLMFLTMFYAPLGPVSFLMMIGGVALFWYSQLAKRRARDAYPKELTIGQLAADPMITVETRNPAQATALEENIRNRLGRLKDFFTATHELSRPRAFEL